MIKRWLELEPVKIHMKGSYFYNLLLLIVVIYSNSKDAT